MPIVLIDQTTLYPDGKVGDDAYDAFAKVNQNFTSQQADIDAEVQTRLQADNALSARIDALPTNTSLQNEITARQNGDTALGQRITTELGAEVTARADADTTLSQQISAEATARADADNALSQAIVAEVTARQNADTEIGARILGKNGFINGDFEWWQRGTTFNGAAYTADRWYFNAGGVASPNVVRNPIAPGQFANIKAPAFARVSYGAISDAAAHFVVFEQLIEGAETYAGQRVTVSFKVFNSGAAGRQIALELRQNFGTGGSATVSGIGSKKYALVAGINTITHTVDVPSVSGKTFGANNSLGFAFWASAGTNWNARSDSLGAQSGDVHFTEVQIEVGGVATPFERVPKAISLLNCQRYCIVDRNGSNGTSRMNVGVAFFFGSNTAYIPYNYPTMRAVPAVTISPAANWRILNNGGATNVSAISTAEVSANRLTVSATVSGQTAGYSGILQSVDGATSGIGILLDAEL